MWNVFAHSIAYTDSMFYWHVGFASFHFYLVCNYQTTSKSQNACFIFVANEIRSCSESSEGHESWDQYYSSPEQSWTRNRKYPLEHSYQKKFAIIVIIILFLLLLVCQVCHLSAWWEFDILHTLVTWLCNEYHVISTL